MFGRGVRGPLWASWGKDGQLELKLLDPNSWTETAPLSPLRYGLLCFQTATTYFFALRTYLTMPDWKKSTGQIIAGGAHFRKNRSFANDSTLAQILTARKAKPWQLFNRHVPGIQGGDARKRKEQDRLWTFGTIWHTQMRVGIYGESIRYLEGMRNSGGWEDPAYRHDHWGFPKK